MSDKQSNLTDKEMEDFQSVVADTLASVCAMADKHSIDRDSMLKYFADMLTAFTEVASIQNYETNYTCNCQHNSNSRDNEPCCGCDSGHTNADRIRNMSDEELVDFICSIETYEEGSIKTIENGVPMHTVTEVREWLQSEMKVKESEEK